MTSSPIPTRNRVTAHPLFWLGIALAIVGLCGHLFSARAIGGSAIAYRDHIAGFAIGAVVFGLFIFLLGRPLFRGRLYLAVFLWGVLQAGFGVWVYTQRYQVANYPHPGRTQN